MEMKERVRHFYTGTESIIPGKSLRNRMRTACAIIIFLVLLAAAGITDTAYGQEADVSLSGGGTFEKGDTITLTVQYTGGTFGSATGRITYDSDILTYQSCSGAEAHGNGGTVVFNMSDGTGKESLRCKLKFKAVSPGKSDVKLSTSDIYNIDLTEMSAASRTTSVTIKKTASSASSNADLPALKVSAGSDSDSLDVQQAEEEDVTAYLLAAFGITLTALLITIIVLQIRILKDSAKKSEGIERKERKKKT